METAVLISFIGATTMLAISPGPDNIFVLIQSISNGVKYGLATVFGLITGCIIHTSLVAFGVAAFIKEREDLFFLLKIFGAAYLIYLAYKVYKSEAAIKLTADKITHKKPLQLFKQGFVMNVLNPKVSIFFLAFFPSFLFSESLDPVVQFFILGAIFMGVSLVIFSSIAVLAGAIASYLKRHKKVGIILKWLQILVFLGIAIFILISD